MAVVLECTAPLVSGACPVEAQVWVDQTSAFVTPDQLTPILSTWFVLMCIAAGVRFVVRSIRGGQ